MTAAVVVEWWKLRSSTVVRIASVLVALGVPLLGFAFHEVARSGGVGALAFKAEALLIGEGWEAYLGLVSQVSAAAVFVGAGIVVSWSFGREHADGLFGSLFGRPTGRGSIAAAKAGLLVGWASALAVVVVFVAVVVGMVGGMGPPTTGMWSPAGRLFVVTALAGALGLTVAIAASAGRGYLPAIGVTVVLVAVAQVTVVFGSGAWFPWAVPGLLAVAASPDVVAPTGTQVLWSVAIVVLSVGVTVGWWRRAEVVARPTS